MTDEISRSIIWCVHSEGVNGCVASAEEVMCPMPTDYVAPPDCPAGCEPDRGDIMKFGRKSILFATAPAPGGSGGASPSDKFDPSGTESAADPCPTGCMASMAGKAEA